MVIVWHCELFSNASHLIWPRHDECLICMIFYTQLNLNKMKSLPNGLSPAGPHGLIIFEKELVGIAVA